MRHILIAVCTLPPAIATAQTSPYTIEIHVDPPIIEPGETTTIELRGHFRPPIDFAMAYAYTSVVCDTGSEFLSDYRVLVPMTGPGTERGSRTLAGIEGIIAGQLQFHDIRADPRNPMPFWAATYTASLIPPVHASEVGFETRTSRYGVYLCEFCSTSESRLHLLEDGRATLRIVACRADFNEDGVADIFDFLAFMNAFDAGEALADFDFDGELTVFDFLAFQDRFDSGC